MRVILVVVLGFTTLLSAQSFKDKKLEEIDKRIAELQKQIEGLQALKTVVSSGQLPDAALNQIVVGSSADAMPASALSGAPVFPGSKMAVAAQPSTPVVQPEPTAAANNPAPAPAASGTPTGQTTSKGQTIYEGPRGGRYHYSASGKKVYERKK